MRRVTSRAAWVGLALLAACTADASPSDLERGAAYVSDPAYRRAVLERSLVNPENGYSALRLERYTEATWGALPIWNPRVRPVLVSDLGGPVPTPDADWAPLDLDVPWEDATLAELGAHAFSDYPAQVEPALLMALTDADAPARFGLWVDGDRVGGLVWAETPGGVQPAFTCASCHAIPRDDGPGVVLGAPNHAIDYGALLDASHSAHTSAGRWGPGRVDVTPDDADNPTVIADLRAVRFQRHLNRAATISNDLMALTVRLETAVIINSRQAVRPPRELAFALAHYLWGLGDTLPALPADGAGAAVFARECGRCHLPPGLAGPPVALAAVATDLTVGESPWRGTGAYQTTSLRGVARRGRLLAGGAVDTLERLLDPERVDGGHRYGQTLDDVDRALLLAVLGELR